MNILKLKPYLVRLTIILASSIFSINLATAEVVWNGPSPCDENEKRSISATITNNKAIDSKFKIEIYDGICFVHGSNEVFIKKNKTKTITLNGIPEGKFKTIIKQGVEKIAEKKYNYENCKVKWGNPSPCDGNYKRSISATIKKSASTDKFKIEVYNGQQLIRSSQEVLINQDDPKTVTLNGIPKGEFNTIVKQGAQILAEKIFNYGTCEVQIQMEHYTRQIGQELNARVYVSAENWDVRIKEIGLTITYDDNILEVLSYNSDPKKTKWKIHHLIDANVDILANGVIKLTGKSKYDNGFRGDRTMWEIPFVDKGDTFEYSDIKIEVDTLMGVDEDENAKILSRTIKNGSVKYTAKPEFEKHTDDINKACKNNLLKPINKNFNTKEDQTWKVWYNNARRVGQEPECENNNDCVARGSVYMGISALKIPNGYADGAYYNDLFEYVYNIDNPTTFTLSAYARYDILDLSGWAGIGVHYYNDARQYIGQEAVGVYGEDWQHYQLDLEIPKETKWIKVWAYKTEPGTAYFDGMCFTVSDNLMQSNAGFEKVPSNQNWYLPETEIVQKFAGNWAAVVNENAQQGGGVYDMIEINPATNYTISAFAKITENPTKAFLGVHYYNQHGEQMGPKSLVDITGTNYQSYKVSFTPPANAKYIKPVFWKSGTGSLFVDDFRLIETPECSNKKGIIWGYDNYSYLCKPPNEKCKDPTLMNQFGVDWYVNVGGAPNIPFNDNETIEAEYFKATHRHSNKDAYDQHFCHAKNVACLDEPYNLGFNEPDLVGQADMTVDKAIEHWAHMCKFKGALGSPCTFEDETKPNSWFEQFMTKLEEVNQTIVNEEDKLRVDFLQVHYYHHEHQINHLKKYLDTLWNKYQKPIWITEFGLTKENATMQHQAAFMREALLLFESLDYVHRYTWFGSYGDPQAPNWKHNLMDVNNNLTILGESYRDLPYNKSDCRTTKQNQMNRNGQFDNSSALLVPRNIEPLNLYHIKTNPNPSTGLIKVALHAKESTNLTVQIIGLEGKVFLNDKISVEENANQFPLDLTHLPNGLYLLNLNDGEHTYAQKIKILR